MIGYTFAAVVSAINGYDAGNKAVREWREFWWNMRSNDEELEK